MANENDSPQRRHAYLILMLIALSIVAGRIATVSSKEGDTAFLSANDRSRWCTIAALVEARTYEIDPLINLKNKQGRRPWYTIDMVRHRGDDGQLHYYSSKPPLFPTLVAGVYWLVYQVSGMTLSGQPIYVGRIVLALVNLPLLATFFAATIGTIERLGSGQWTRITTAAATCFATMMMPFAVSLNNHLVAAASTALVMVIYVTAAVACREADGGRKPTSKWIWLIGGMAAGFTAANELPALSMMVFWCLLVLLLDLRATLSFLTGIAIVAAAFFGTNKLAHDSFRPPYSHRDDGARIAMIESTEAPPAANQVAQTLSDHDVEFDSFEKLEITQSGESARWVVQSADQRLFSLRQVMPDEGTVWDLRHWDDWYDYPTSYWVEGKRRGVDLGEPSRSRYFANITVGHYGIFSLTPIWCLVPIGLLVGLFSGPGSIRRFVFAVGVATVVCMAFYLMRPEIDRNYGGVSSCFRWMLWFAPLWLAVIVPVVQWCSRGTATRLMIGALLACSVFSMAISLESPWQHPWIYRFWSFLGWIGD